MKLRTLRVLLAAALAGTALGSVAPTTMASSGDPGDPTIVITINDSYAGGSYDQVFELVYENETASETPVYIYVPEGAIGDPTVESVDPQYDHNPADEFEPCATTPDSDHLITQAQIDQMGDALTDQIVAVDEAHFGEIGLADASDPDSDALVLLAYNVQDQMYYDCAETTYTAGYFAPEYIEDAGMNAIVIDTLDWANSVGAPDYAYEGIIAHELEHLVHNYSDPGELSWVDEGLADMAAFLNDFPGAFDSHLLFHQVLHRETSLTRWGGGLENYGAAFTYFLYLWEQAGGNGDGTLDPDGEYDAAGGDLLIKLIFENQLDGMEGVNAAIAEYEAQTGEDLRTAEEFYEDWAIAVYLDDEDSDLYNLANVDFGPDSGNWTISVANDVFWEGRGNYKGAMPPARWRNNKDVPAQVALPFGVSYETFRNPGPTFNVFFDGEDSSRVAPQSGETHWYAGYESQSDNILNVDSAVSGGQTVDFWTWYFIEEGWDYGYVEALVNGVWTPIDVTTDDGTSVTTDTDPHGNNEEGNGITGTSGGAYFVDEPEYIHLTGTLPAGTTDVRFRYQTDAAYLDTGWFVDDVQVNGADADLSSPDGEWFETTGEQDNNWTVQILSPCDLTPGVTSAFESNDGAGNYVYRLEGDLINQAGFSTACLRSSKAGIVVAVSNLPDGDLTFLDADYVFRLTNTGNRK